MGDAPWFKFFPSDWLSGTRRLSGLERGVYISLIALMYDQGKPLSDDPKELADDCGVTRRQFDAALAQLLRRGKIVQTENGLWNERVSCEILARSERISNSKAAVAERERKKAEQNQRPETSADDRTMNGGSSIQNQNQNQKENKKKEKEEIRPKPAAPVPDLFVSDEDHEGSSEPGSKPVRTRKPYPADFETFWKAYPTESGMSKFDAAKSWGRMTEEDRAAAIAAIPEFRKWAAKKGPTYPMLHAATFLNQRRYEGFVATSSAGSATDVSEWQSRLASARRLKVWDTAKWGPWPHTPGCLVPKNLLEPDDGHGWQEFKRAS